MEIEVAAGLVIFALIGLIAIIYIWSKDSE